MEARLKNALEKRDTLNTKIQRLKGRLDMAIQDRDQVIQDIRAKNIDPNNLENTITLLEEKYETLLSQFESDLNTLQNKLTQYMENSK